MDYIFLLIIVGAIILFVGNKFYNLTLYIVFVLPFLPKWNGIILFGNFFVLSPLKLLLLMLIFSWLINRGKYRANDRSHIPILFPIILFVISEIFSWLNSFLLGSGDYILGLNFLLGRIFYFFLITIIIYEVINDKGKINQIILILVISAFLNGLFSIMEFTFHYNPYNSLPRNDIEMGILKSVEFQQRLGVTRSQGAFTMSIPFGMYLGMILPLSYYLISISKKKTAKIRWIVVATIIYIGIIFTISRGAILPATMLLIFVLLRNKQGRIFLASLIVFLIAGYSILTKFIDFTIIKALVLSAIDPTSNSVVGEEMFSSSMGRIDSIETGIKLMISSFPLGFGPQWRTQQYEIVVPYFILLYIRSGIMAFIGFILIIFKPIRSLLKEYKKCNDKELKNLIFYLLISILTFAISIQTVDQEDSFFFIFIIIAISFRVLYLNKLTKTNAQFEIN